MEQTFRRAYGYDRVCEETRHALLYAQLQEGLKYAIVEAPAVSGSQTYRELCIAAKNEERRQSELMKRQQYATRTNLQQGANGTPRGNARGAPRNPAAMSKTSRAPPQKRCYICNSPEHLASQCNAKKGESQGKTKDTQNKKTAKRVVRGREETPQSETVSTQDVNQNPLDLLYSSDSDEGEVCTVRVSDTGSKPQCARVLVQGVPTFGIIDTAADITIMGGTLFGKLQVLQD